MLGNIKKYEKASIDFLKFVSPEDRLTTEVCFLYVCVYFKQ